jgi:hypothetical protein
VESAVKWRAAAQRAWRLAAPSLWGLACLACLDDAPEFPERRQIPPFVLMGHVEPPVAEIYSNGLPIRINVPFRSEDVNEDVTPALFLDLKPADPNPPAPVFLERDLIPLSTYDDEERFFKFEVGELGVAPGCHTLTLILTYGSNLDRSNLPQDEARAARVIWWLDSSAPATNVLLRSCPHSN